MKSAGLDFPIEDEVAIYHEEQQKHLLTTSQYTQKNKAKQPVINARLFNQTLLLVQNHLSQSNQRQPA